MLLKVTLNGNCETDLCTLKFHLLDHIVRDLDCFVFLELLGQSVNYGFGVHRKGGTGPLFSREALLC